MYIYKQIRLHAGISQAIFKQPIYNTIKQAHARDSVLDWNVKPARRDSNLCRLLQGSPCKSNPPAEIPLKLTTLSLKGLQATRYGRHDH